MDKLLPAKKCKNHPFFIYEVWGDELFNTYADLARYDAALHNPNLPFVVKQHIKSAMFRDLRSGAKTIRDLFEEHKEKLQRGDDYCWYCHRPVPECGPLQAEHILPKNKGGLERSEGNIAFACRNCNSSKGTKDFIQWYSEIFDNLPDLQLLRMYLKNVYQFSIEKGLMDKTSEEVEAILSLPFSPHSMSIIRKLLKIATKIP